MFPLDKAVELPNHCAKMPFGTAVLSCGVFRVLRERRHVFLLDLVRNDGSL